jgi:formate/nitrite transporter
MLSPSELTGKYSQLGAEKASLPAWKMLLLGISAGFLIGMGAAVANTASHSITNVSAARIISGLLFPFGLAIVILLGAELFTGDCMIVISVLEKKTSVGRLLKNWAFVYIGNFIGAGALAAANAFCGQLDYSNGGLAAYTIKVAAAKSALPFGNAFVLGILCNVLVCMGVLCAISAKDTGGKILGAYIPVAFFVICGFEHCVANMYYIAAGLFAKTIPAYAAKAAAMGVHTGSLSWGNFLLHNLVPVTLGNIVGGVAIAVLMWACFLRRSEPLVLEQARQVAAS